MIDFEKMNIAELMALQNNVEQALCAKRSALFKEKVTAIECAIEDLVKSFPYASWELEWDDEYGSQYVDLFQQWDVHNLVKKISP